MTAYVYITASQLNGTLYIGATADLKTRIKRHRMRSPDHFTNVHQANRLVYFEPHPTPKEAFAREKQLKKWNRSWKIKLIESKNPTWKDLYQNI